MSPIYNKSENNCFNGQTVSLSPRESIHVISRSRESVLCESIHVARAKTSRNMPQVISRSRESVLCESIHVAGAKTSRNMPIHDETGLLAQFNARENQCSWEESTTRDRISNRSEVRLLSRDREGSSGPGTTDPGPTMTPATRLACEARGGWGWGRGSFSLCFRAIAIVRLFSRSLSRRSPRK